MANNNFLSSPFDSVAVSSEFTDTPPAQVETPKPKATAAVVTPRVSAPSKNDLIARANELGVDPNLALSFFSQESSGNWNSKDSPKGARGGMQVMPGTFKMMMGTAAGQDDPWQNMEAGLRYIRYGQTKLKTKDPELLAAGYHAGYDNPSLARGQIPNTNDGMINTRDYAKSVAGRLGKSSKTASIDDEFSDTPPKLTDADFSDTPVAVDKSNDDAWDAEFSKQKVDAKPYWDRLKDETKAGFGDMVRSIDTARWALGSGDDTDIAKQIADNIQAQSKATKNKSQQEIDAAYKQVTDAKGVIDTTAAGAKALYTSITNPSETFIEVARNAANALPTIGAGAAGAGAGAAAGSVIPGAGTALGAVLGGRAGMIAGTTATELGAEIQDMIGKRLESNNQAPTAQNVLAIISDQKFKEEARKQGLAKGLTVAAVDQVFFGIGGKVATAPARKLATRDLAAQGVDVSTRAARNQALSSAAGQTALQAAKPSIAARAGAGAAAIGIDAGGETLGEGLSQKVARGEVDYGDALREGVTSLGQSAVEVGISAATQGYRAGAQAAKSIVQPTKSEAAGPLARAAENAAAENERVTVTAPTGEKVTGEVTGKAEDGTTQVTTDDGQQVTFKVGENGITMEPEAPNTPLSNAVEAAAAEQPARSNIESGPATWNSADYDYNVDVVGIEPQPGPDGRTYARVVMDGKESFVPADELKPRAEVKAETAAPQQAAPTETIERPAPQAKVDYKTMSEPELKSRLDYLNNQAKTNGGWNKLLYTERRAVENAISKLPKPDETEVKQFAPETGTLGIPRAEMPQVKSEHHGALVNHLNAQGIAHETTRVDAATLKPTQAEYSPAKVERAKEEGNGERSIIVSSDNHIIDGHHQAIAAAEKGEQVKAIVLDAPAEKALEAVKQFPSATTESMKSSYDLGYEAGKEGLGRRDVPKHLSPEDANNWKQGVSDYYQAEIKEKELKEKKEDVKSRALSRIAAGRAWFNDGVKAKDFIKKNDLTDTHEAKKGKGGRWDIVAKATAEKSSEAPTVRESLTVQSATQQETVNVNDERTQQQPNGREEGQRTEAAAPAAVQSDAAQEVRTPSKVDEADIVQVKDTYGRTHRVRKTDLEGNADRISTVRKNGDVVVGEEIPRNIIKQDAQTKSDAVTDPAKAKEGDIIETGGVKFRKTANGFERVADEPASSSGGKASVSESGSNSLLADSDSPSNLTKAEATDKIGVSSVNVPLGNASRTHRESDAAERSPNISGIGSNSLTDLLKSQPGLVKSFGSIDVPAKRVVLSSVIASLQNLKIRKAVVGLLPVDVVDVLGREQLTPDSALNEDAMLKRVLSLANGDGDVTSGRDSASALVRATASVVAEGEPTLGEFRLDAGSFLPAESAGEVNAASAGAVDAEHNGHSNNKEDSSVTRINENEFVNNKIFTADKVAAARARLKSKLTQLNSGIDPEVLVDGLTISGAYIESGVREFGEYAKRMISDFGNEITPFLLSFWEAARNYPGIDNKDMTSVRESARAHAAMMEKPAAAANVEPVKESDDGNTNTAPSAGSAGDRALEGKPAEDVPSAEAVGNAEQSGNGSGAENTGRAGNADRKRNTPRGRVGNGAGDVSVPAGRARSQRGSTQQSGLFDQPPAEQADQRDVEVKQARESKPAGANYKITDLTKLGEGGQKTKYRNNVAAIKLLNELQEAGRQATAEEQDTLARYVGWGGLAQAFDAANSEWSKEHAELKELLTPEEWESAKESTQYAHYTSQEIIGGIYDALKRFGFGGGTALEPGSGVGNFMGMLPDALRGNTRFTAVERERIAGGIAKLLYPNHNVQQEDFRSFNAQDGYFDVAIGNPPFSATTLTDLTGRKHLSGLSIHNYFFAKSIDMLREGGVLAMVVSNAFMDAKTDRARKYIGDRAELLGAIRLPNNAFAKNANTEVTTDIIFLKKRPESEWGSRAAKEDMRRWVDIGSISDPRGGESIPVNRYFIDNPSMMLGRMERSGSMYRADAPALVAREGQDTASLLKQAIQNLPEGVYEAVATANTAKMEDAAIEKLSDKATVDVGGHYVDGDKLYVRMPDVAGEGRAMQLTATTKISEKKDLGKNGLERLKSLAQMRVTLRSLLSAELKDASNMESLRKQLNTEYDAYVKQFGYINQRGTIQLYGDDPDFPLLASLELSYDPGISRAAAEKQGVKAQEPSAKKAAIFKQRVIPKYEEVTSAETPEDALFVSIAERGQIDAAYIGKLLGQDGEAVLKDLASQNNPSVFIDPATGGYALKDAYLSGNVRKKMEQAKAAGMFQNVAALEAVIPEDIPAHEISGKIGAPWVPVETYEEFAKTIMGEGTTAKITYVPALSSYVANFAPGSDVSNKNTYGTSRMGADEIMSALLNSKEIKVGHYEEEPGGGRRFVLEKEPTDEANDKAREIKDKFADWLFADGERSEKLQRAYNDAVNNYVTREFDGSMLKFPGKVPDSIIKLRRHQRNAVARIVQDGRALLDHVVGAGKAGSLDSKLLTPDGWVRMGDIKVGDYVISHDGTPTLVEAIFPQGDKEIFKVIFSDGSSTECCDEHLWLTWNYQERSYSQRMLKLGKQWECGMPKVRPLSEIRQTLVSDHLGAKNHSIPMVQPVQFNERHIPLDPYLVGALIGDGHIGEKAVSISGADDEVFYELNLPEGVRARENGDKTRCKSLHLVGTVPGKNPALDALRELGLTGKLSHEKFVPDAYKFNTADIRLAVLRGLMDTDGWVEKAGKTTAFTTVSRQLADDVTFLVQSFGGVALLTEKRPKYSHKGEKRDGRVAYRLTIKMPADINPFHISRKRDAVVAKTSYAPARYIVSVESIGMKPAQCIRVEHPSHLYVTDDFIVTHNTYTVIAAAMELKRTGLAKKPMIAVPNHLVKQWAADFYRLYPGANILTATKKDFERANRRKFLAKIATGNWDAVIMAHSSFGFIKPEPEFEIRFNAERVSEIIEAMQALKDEKDQNSKRTVKQLAKMKEGLENKLASLRDRPMDDLLDFGQIGVDQLFVDEAHLFKNLMYVTKMQNVRGLGQAKGSQRAYDMFIKTHQLYDNSENGRGVVFATGTPVSNSLAEMYHMLRYLAPETLKDSGQFTFDAWAKTFADVEQVWMQSLSGDGYKASNRMSVFANTPELLKVFDQVADTVTIDDIKKAYAEENGGKEFPIPPLKGGRRTPVSIPKSAAQNAYMAEIGERAKKLEQRKGKPQKGDDNMLSIMGDARKAAMDIRMVRPDITQRDPEGRIAVAARNVYDRYVKYNDVRGTQLIFSDMGTPKKSAEKELKEYNDLMAETAPLRDERVQAMADLGDESALDQIEKAEEAQRKIDAKGQDWADAIKMAMRGFSIYDDMKDALIELGIPENEIAFIHDYNTDDQKAALFRAVNDGKVRVLLGSTEKMGAGTNVQERAVALHHLDVPWKPSDIEQREGRVIRQGNSLITPDSPNYTPGFEVEVMAYATQDTLDLFMWQTQEKKLSMIGQLRTGNVGREVDNAFEEMQMSAGEMQAAATSNPYLLEEIQLKDRIKKLERQKRSFDGQKNDLANRLAKAQRDIEQLPDSIKKAEGIEAKAMKATEDMRADFKSMTATVNGETITGAMDIRSAVREAVWSAPEIEKDGKTVRDIKIEFNGKEYKSESGVSEAVIKALGDAAEASFTLPDGTKSYRGSETAAALFDTVSSMQDGDEKKLGSIGAFDVVAYQYQGVREANLELDGTSVASEILPKDLEMLLGRLRSMPVKFRDALNQQRGVPDYLRSKLEAAKRAKAEIEAMPAAGAWEGEKDLKAAREKYKEVLKKLAERESDKGTDTAAFSRSSDLVDVFAGLEAGGIAKIKAERLLAGMPNADRIQFIENNFFEILGELDDSGKVIIKC